MLISVRIDRVPSDPRRWRAELRVLHADTGRVAGFRTVERVAESCEPIEDLLAFMTALILSGAPPTPTSPTMTTTTVVPAPVVAQRSAVGPQTVARSIVSLPPPAPARHTSADATSGVAGSEGESDPRRRSGDDGVTGLLPPIAIAVSVAGDVGILPASTAGPSLGGGLEVSLGRRASPTTAFLYGLIWPTRSTLIDSARGATVGQQSVGVGACPLAWQMGSRRVAACAAFELGLLSATGFGLDGAARTRHATASVCLGARFMQRIVHDLFVALQVDGAVALTRVRLVYAGNMGETEELSGTWPVATRAQIQLGWVIP